MDSAVFLTGTIIVLAVLVGVAVVIWRTSNKRVKLLEAELERRDEEARNTYSPISVTKVRKVE